MTRHKGRRVPEFLFPLLMIGMLLPAACAAEYTPEFPFLSGAAGGSLRALSKKSVPGTLVLGKQQSLEYGFSPPLDVPPDCSLEIDYAVEGGRELRGAGQLALEAGGAVWALPLDASFLGLEAQPARIRYALPVSSLEKITLSWVPLERDGNGAGRVKILGIGLGQRWYGFSLDGGLLAATPFVFVPQGGASGPEQAGGPALPPALGINPPGGLRISSGVELLAVGSGGAAMLVEAGLAGFERRAVNTGGPNRLFIPSGSLPADPWPFTVRCAGGVASLRVYPAPDRPFPAEPIPADPGLVLDYPRTAWRDSRYEVFRWEDFPSALIFDFADYAVQDRFLKRLAFYVEKAGFRGRLAADREIASLHGWNAHDYRPQDLAAFFEAARSVNFPLLPEERELEQTLAGAGILRRGEDGSVVAGEGALISISRESPGYLRARLLTHECFHGIFFIDQDFREFSRRRWENLSPQADRFIRALFASMAYDTGDTGLMINELMAYCLQQPVSQAARFFGEVQAGRLAELPLRRAALPPRDEATGTWPDIAAAFRSEAAAFSDYVERRWGLAAGRVMQVRARALNPP